MDTNPQEWKPNGAKIVTIDNCPELEGTFDPLFEISESGLPRVMAEPPQRVAPLSWGYPDDAEADSVRGWVKVTDLGQSVMTNCPLPNDAALEAAFWGGRLWLRLVGGEADIRRGSYDDDSESPLEETAAGGAQCCVSEAWMPEGAEGGIMPLLTIVPMEKRDTLLKPNGNWNTALSAGILAQFCYPDSKLYAVWVRIYVFLSGGSIAFYTDVKEHDKPGEVMPLTFQGNAIFDVSAENGDDTENDDIQELGSGEAFEGQLFTIGLDSLPGEAGNPHRHPEICICAHNGQTLGMIPGHRDANNYIFEHNNIDVPALLDECTCSLASRSMSYYGGDAWQENDEFFFMLWPGNICNPDPQAWREARRQKALGPGSDLGDVNDIAFGGRVPSLYFTEKEWAQARGLPTGWDIVADPWRKITGNTYDNDGDKLHIVIFGTQHDGTLAIVSNFVPLSLNHWMNA